MNHETQLDLRLSGSKEFSLLLKLILYTSFEVITGFLCPSNRRIRFKTQFHAIVSLVENTFQTANKQGRAERKLLHVKMSSGATYAVRRRRTRLRAIPLALTKISRIDCLPFFLTHGALRARALRTRAECRYNLEWRKTSFFSKTDLQIERPPHTGTRSLRLHKINRQSANICFVQLILETAEYDERIFQIRSWVESKYKSQYPRDPHDSCQFQYNHGKVSLVYSRHVSLSEQVTHLNLTFHPYTTLSAFAARLKTFWLKLLGFENSPRTFSPGNTGFRQCSVVNNLVCSPPGLLAPFPFDINLLPLSGLKHVYWN